MDFLVKKYYGDAQPAVGPNILKFKTLEQTTPTLNGYCHLETPNAVKQAELHVGKYIRENQLISASACTSFKSSLYLKEALCGQNVKLLDQCQLVADQQTGELRTRQLTPLMVACKMGNKQTVQTLVEHARIHFDSETDEFSQFVNIKSQRCLGGNSALMFACNSSQGNYLLVQYLVDHAGADPNFRNDANRNALHLAAQKNQLNIVDLLIQRNVDVSAVDSNYCKQVGLVSITLSSVLHIASSEGFLEVVETIILHRSKMQRAKLQVLDINQQDDFSLTPLMRAASNGHLEIVKLLLKFGANPRMKNQRGESALAMACSQEHLEICERLIVAKADVNEVDDRKWTPLLKAARNNAQPDILSLLVKHGARQDIADDEGNTPLHCAAIRGTAVVGDFLIKAGANPYARNRKGFVPYEVTCREEIKQVLQACPVCLKPTSIQCTRCLIVRYCDVQCQKKDWATHKKSCENYKRRLPGGIGLG